MAHQACTVNAQLHASAQTLAAGSTWHCVWHKFRITPPALEVQVLHLRLTCLIRSLYKIPQWNYKTVMLDTILFFISSIIISLCKTCGHLFKRHKTVICRYIKAKKCAELVYYYEDLYSNYSNNQRNFNYLCSGNPLNQNRPCMNDNLVSY